MRWWMLTFALLLGICSEMCQNHTIPTAKVRNYHTFGRTVKLLRGELDSQVQPFALMNSDAKDLYKHIQKTIKKYPRRPILSEGRCKTHHATADVKPDIKGVGISLVDLTTAIGLCGNAFACLERVSTDF